MPTTFATPINDAAGVLASTRAIGGGSLALQSGQGARFGSPSPSAPIRVTLQRADDESAWTILSCTGRTGDTLTGLAVIEGSTDRLYSPGDLAEMRITAGTLGDLHSAVIAAETAIGGKADASALTAHTSNTSNPHGTTANQVGAYSAGQVDSLLSGVASVGALTAHVTDSGNPHGVTKTQVGLANVDNTSDAGKPLSTAATAALAGKANATHTHIIGDVTGLQVAIDGKAPTSHTHLLAQITDFASGLASALAAWVGSTAQTTLGTITTGVWQGTKIAVAYLGSGTPAAGKYLDGAGSWTTLPSGGGGSTSPGGADTQIQYNASGSFGASSNLRYDGSDLIVNGSNSGIKLNAGGGFANIRFISSSNTWQFATGGAFASGYEGAWYLFNEGTSTVPFGVTPANDIGLGGALSGVNATSVKSAILLIATTGQRVGVNMGGATPLGALHARGVATGDPALAVESPSGQSVPDQQFYKPSSTGTVRPTAAISAGWVASTDATRAAYLALSAADWAGTRTVIRIEADGTQGKLGFFGVTPVARPTGDIATALTSLGLMASPTRPASLLYSQVADGTVTNTTTETSLVNTSGAVGAYPTLTLPAGFWTVGRSVVIEARGVYSTAASAPGTLAHNLKLASVVLLNVPSTNLTASMAGRSWWFKAILTCRSAGVSGTLSVQGDYSRATAAGTSGAVVDSKNAAPITVDTTASATLDLTALHGTANAANIFTCTNLTVQALN